MNSENLQDTDKHYPVLSHEVVWQGGAFGLASDEVVLGIGEKPIKRDYLLHPGAVGIVAIRGEAGAEEILLIRQYRHPIRKELWEIPAGLLDHADEDIFSAGARELAEETDLRADTWSELTQLYTSPGCSQEKLTILLAQDVCEIPKEARFVRKDEEKRMVSRWVGLEEALAAVLSGRLTNPAAVVGILATKVARNLG